MIPSSVCQPWPPDQPGQAGIVVHPRSYTTPGDTTDGTELAGTDPLVIIGPNGVGKTRLSVALAKKNGAERVSAIRELGVETIQMQPKEKASNYIRQTLANTEKQTWIASSELTHLLSEILIEDKDNAVEYRTIARSGVDIGKIPEQLSNTRKEKIVSLWNSLYPQRVLNLDYKPTVTRTDCSPPQTYSIARMSEGERTCLYLIARIISCKNHTLIVDEPETYLHPLLAETLFAALEEQRPEIQFIYITHSMPFALSRRNATIAIARSDTSLEIVADRAAIPDSVFADVLGAASLSIAASRVVFCEGDVSSFDHVFYSAWYRCKRTEVVPVGGCSTVRECVNTFLSGKVTKNIEPFGHIDRDNWPDKFLGETKNVTPLPINEIELIFSFKSVFEALCELNQLTSLKLSSELYDEFIAEAKIKAKSALPHTILLRSKQRVEIEQRGLFNSVRANSDYAVMRQGFSTTSPKGGWQAYLEALMDEERERLVMSLNSPATLIRDFPGKTIAEAAHQVTGLSTPVLRQQVISSLRATPQSLEKNRPLECVKLALEAALGNVLGPRTI
ncbi:MAG: ABC transporter ATP-binding protein [Xanthobacteraceae bacterium]|nr:MAG: ABC transporter ATP-binding protein [Xanthobacteraceae bacterium]